MKKSKKVLLSAAIAAAIMGSVSVPQIQADDVNVNADNVYATTGSFSNLSVGGKANIQVITDGVSISDNLNVGDNVQANTINATTAISSKQISGTTVYADKVDANEVSAKTTQTGSLQVTGDTRFTGDTRLEGTTSADTITANNANVVNSNISNLSVSGKAEFKLSLMEFPSVIT